MDIHYHEIKDSSMPSKLVTFEDYFHFMSYYLKHTIKGKTITCFYTEDRAVFYVPCEIHALNVVKMQLDKFSQPTVRVEIYNDEKKVRALMDANPKEFV